MIANDIFTSCFGIVPAGDEESLARVARQAVRNGFALVVTEPGGKKPLCTLTARQAKAEDRVVQDAARAAGDANWTRRRHDCGIAHAITDDTAATRIVGRLVRERGRVNFGVEVGRSRMLVVDVDTAGQREAFLTEWGRETGTDMTDRMPTVLSPGKVKVTDQGEEKWVHKDGGHFWFSLPDGAELAELPGNGVLVGEGGWTATWRDHQVIVPPSIRAEGPYQLVGQVEPAPQWLLDRIALMAHSYAERKRQQKAKARYADDPIDGWAATTPWAELLAPDGWTDTGLPDTCDCTIWTRPGDASHAKSATAHELGCTKYDMTGGHGPLYLWTDNPPEYLAAAVRATGKRAVTKLQYVAHRDHAGDMGAAMRALELGALGGAADFGDLWETGPAAPASEPQAAQDDEGQGQDPAAGTAAPGPSEPVEDDPEPPAEYLAFRKALDAEKLPRWLRQEVGQAWQREYVLETYRRLRNKGTVEEIRERMRSSVDRLSNVAEDDEVDLYRIEGLWLQGQVAMLTAKWKAGKTTMVTNVIRSLVDGTPFLGRFPTTVVEGSVFIVNAEMTRRQFNRWMYESPIVNRDKVYAFHVRDAGPQSGDIIDPTRRSELVDLLIECDAQVLILDPLNPLFAAAGIDEDKSSQVAPWFTALADIIERTGVREVLLVHHFGHSGGRARGSSKLMDAPDVLWTYTVEEVEDEPEEGDEDDLLGTIEAPAAPRYLQAVGRDVDVPKGLVTFNPETRELTMPERDGQPVSRGSAAAQQRRRRQATLVRRIVREVGDHQGITSNALHTLIGGNKAEFQAARDEAVRTDQLRTEPGPNRSTRYFTAAEEPPVGPVGPGETK